MCNWQNSCWGLSCLRGDESVIVVINRLRLAHATEVRGGRFLHSTDTKIDTEPTKEKHDGRYQQILDEGVVGQELEIDSHKTKRKKTQSDRNLIMSGLRGNLVCSTLKEPEILALCDAMEYFVFILGDVVCQQGSLGSYFFIIDSGKFEVSINGKAINCMKKGKAFGEIALIHNTPRSATVKALTKGGVWGVQRTTFRNILKQLSSK